ncbi:hypothetical protein ACJX0J_021988, partial [Zea mays]
MSQKVTFSHSFLRFSVSPQTEPIMALYLQAEPKLCFMYPLVICFVFSMMENENEYQDEKKEERKIEKQNN